RVPARAARWTPSSVRAGALRLQRGDVTGARADFDAGLQAFRVGDPPSLLDALRRGLQDAAAREGEAR
ncbi:hypothetical protein ACLEQD_40070, partial [Corallococcus sp. 4LFB]